MKTNRDEARSLNRKIDYLTQELATCTTEAMKRCVQETIDDTRRQLRDALRA